MLLSLLADPLPQDLPPQITKTEANKKQLLHTLELRECFYCILRSQQHLCTVTWITQPCHSTLSNNPSSGISACYRHDEPSDHSTPSPPSPATTHNSSKASGFMKTSCDVLAGSFQTKPITSMWIKTQQQNKLCGV